MKTWSFRFWILISAACLTAPSPCALAQQVEAGLEESAEEGTERRELLESQRRAKEARLGPEEQSQVEKAFLYLEEKGLEQLFNIRYKDLYPKVGSPRQGAGWGGGGRFYKPNMGNSDLTLEASAVITSKDYRIAELQFGRFTQMAPMLFLGPTDFTAPFDFVPEEPGRVGRPKFFLYGDLGYRYYPQEDFYGVGNETTRDTRTDYLYESGEVSGVAGYEFSRRLAAAIKVSYLTANIGQGTDEIFPSIGEIFDDSSAPGLQEQPDFLRFTSAVFLNYRDDPGNPHRGGVVGFYFSRYADLGSSRFRFSRYAVDARHYLPLGSPQRTFALRTVAAVDRADEGSSVPFYLMNTLGGDRTLRGYLPFRFRDTDLLYFSGEYRWEPAPAVELALFYDTGKVFPRSRSFDFEDMHSGYGVGLRFKTSKRTILRFDLGRSEENTILYIRSGVAF